MKVVFAGDVFLGGDLIHKDINYIKLPKEYVAADYRIINLESPISDHVEISEKSTLFVRSKEISRLKMLSPDAVNIANNHIFDNQNQGIIDTINILNKNGIKYFGAGENLSEAQKPLFINSKLAVIGYCSHGNSYLKKVKIATNNEPGVNPFSHNKVFKDLRSIGSDIEVIIYVHWGRENVYLPPHEIIKVTKDIFKNDYRDQIRLIVGTHPHKMQGNVEYKGKKAYLSLGNFLFPNFYIRPSKHAKYYDNELAPDTNWVTKEYHFVGKTTYKIHGAANRTSLLVSYQTKTGEISHRIVKQAKDCREIVSVDGELEYGINAFLIILTTIYKLPKYVYGVIYLVFVFFRICFSYTHIFTLLLRQNGLFWLIKRIRNLFLKGATK